MSTGTLTERHSGNDGNWPDVKAARSDENNGGKGVDTAHDTDGRRCEAAKWSGGVRAETVASKSEVEGAA